MGLFDWLFRGYSYTRGRVVHAREHQGNIFIEIAVTKPDIKHVFKGEIEPHKLNGLAVRLSVPKSGSKKAEKKK